MAAHILSPTASLVSYLGSTQLHPTYAPFPLTACIHAARVSLAYRAIVKKVGAAKAGAKEGEVGGREMGWAQNVGGFLVMVSLRRVWRVKMGV